MNCNQFSKYFVAHALGDFNFKALNDHLLICASCCAKYEKIKKTVDLISQNQYLISPAGFERRLYNNLRAYLPPKPVKYRILKYVAGLAAALILSLTVWLVSKHLPCLPAEQNSCPCWRFVGRDPGNSRSMDDQYFPQTVLWQKSLSDAEDIYKPLAWKEYLIVGIKTKGSPRANVAAFHASSGALQWQREIDKSPFQNLSEFPDRCIQKACLYISDGVKCLVLDAAKGRDIDVIMPPAAAHGWGYLAVFDSLLFGVSADGKTLFCVDAFNGRNKWIVNLNKKIYMPALASGRFYYHTADSGLVALDITNGKELWSNTRITACGKSRVIANDQYVMIITQSHNVFLTNAQSGKKLWQRNIPEAFNAGAAMGEEHILLLAGTLALNIADGNTEWHKPPPESGICSWPALTDGQVITNAGRDRCNLSIYSIKGDLLKKIDNPEQPPCHGAIVAHGRMFKVGGNHLLAIACRPKV
ncbi:MAG: PQQ-binding-like beta-propeller repeat protein [bacterium]